MSLAQKDQLLEIGSRVRLGKPIICGRLSVSRDKITNLSAHEVRTNLLFTMSNRTSGEPRSSPQTFLRMTFSFISTRHLFQATILADCAEMVEPDGIEPTTSCLQSRRSPS